MLMRPFGSRGSSWREMERLRREMNRLLADGSVQPQWNVAPGYPAMNVWTTEDSAVVTAELPGVSPEDIDISVHNHMLTLRGSRRAEELDESVTYHRRERTHRAFTRSFHLPFPVDVEQVEAGFENGVLSVSLPRAEADKPKKIVVKTG